MTTSFPFLRVLGIWALLTGPASAQDLPLTPVLIGPGQSVSYLAMLRLGQFNQEVLEQIRKDNPQIADLDKVAVGDTLLLRLAPTPSGTQPAALPPARRLEMASRQAVVTAASGAGTLRRADGTEEPLRANLLAREGDQIITGPSSWAELIIDNQSVLRLHNNTHIELVAIQRRTPQADRRGRQHETTIALQRGRTWSKVQHWAGNLVRHQIRLPNAIAGVHGTVFECAVGEDSVSEVSVHLGEVGVTGGIPQRQSLAPREIEGPREVDAGEWIRIVSQGMRVRVDRDGRPGEPMPIETNAQDAWIDLNRQRDCLCD